MKVLKEILLVDNSPGVNSLNKRLLNSLGVANKISTALNGQQAIDYLKSKNELGVHPEPEVIFLDINMPVMDGYGFIKKYHELGFHMDSNSSVIMLTSSVNTDDIEKSAKYQSIKSYQLKPLKKDDVYQLLEQLGYTKSA